MSNFLIQTANGQIQHDFSFHLQQAVQYQNWYNGEIVHDITYVDNISDSKTTKELIPVGSLDFVFEFIEKTQQKRQEEIKPINIPNALNKREYLKRNIQIQHKDKVELTQPSFVKSNTKYKSFTDIVSDITVAPSEELMISDVVDIDSEWRAFVFRNKLVGIQHYLGDFTMFPEIKLIKNMIDEYTEKPVAFTLDVGINKNGTFLIEVHPFVSCGLYGFADYRILPQMTVAGFRYILEQ